MTWKPTQTLLFCKESKHFIHMTFVHACTLRKCNTDKLNRPHGSHIFGKGRFECTVPRLPVSERITLYGNKSATTRSLAAVCPKSCSYYKLERRNGPCCSKSHCPPWRAPRRPSCQRPRRTCLVQIPKIRRLKSLPDRARQDHGKNLYMVSIK